MIDLHNHLLPGIDDGAPDLETALALAQIAVSDGVTHMVCTPHMHPGRYSNSLESIEASKSSFVNGLKKAHIKLRVATAAEVRFGIELTIGINLNAVPFLGDFEGRRVLLLELPHGEIPFGAERMIDWLVKRNITPMLAHPERNKGILRTPSRLKGFVQQGCLLQVTAGAVTGHFGPTVQTFVHTLLKADMVSIMASDAHNLQHRPPLLYEGMHQVAQIIGDTKAHDLVCATPWAIAQSLFL
ncbi:capsular biosynthesis protein [Pseudomonas sp. MH9.2]|uniref:tyrosine-protein phosphatase n=1 Tax=unclassified Pseudomonas TaxID=196821 RepID=UPI002AC97763|nr:MULTISPECIES: CpsB/CapC family capsule biosynthesis tyrosine phosphatase [unclassified Pseudomonas]MEB0028809.1 capsular biosynthesis protein [Pseudomonas sp. MH9.2]MEB0150089.1 capsular biosynthesis protein [Pseudomonas sp. CCC2.2]MEE3509537.1 capsular biosynthesis protein [Pseudomonas sp. 10C3]WPX68862.1 CpsB/CapC family capsule biosynthesis tyrosine phosphatase [Pseudomonas sp. MH9.2]